MKEQFVLLDDTLIDRFFQPLADRMAERWSSVLFEWHVSSSMPRLWL
jgi:hypothetical protein